MLEKEKKLRRRPLWWEIPSTESKGTKSLLPVSFFITKMAVSRLITANSKLFLVWEMNFLEGTVVWDALTIQVALLANNSRVAVGILLLECKITLMWKHVVMATAFQLGWVENNSATVCLLIQLLWWRKAVKKPHPANSYRKTGNGWKKREVRWVTPCHPSSIFTVERLKKVLLSLVFSFYLSDSTRLSFFFSF